MRCAFKALVLASVTALLVSCAVNPVPPDYKGPRARIADTAVMETSLRAAYFYVAEWNGNVVENNLSRFRNANRGRGMSMSAISHIRDVPAGTTKLKLEARTAYGAPIQELVMAATMRSASQLVEVDLMPDELYEVRGTLADGKDDVWLVLSRTGERVGRMVAVR